MEREEQSELLKKVSKKLHKEKRNAITLRRAFGKPIIYAKTKEKMAYLEVTDDIDAFSDLNSVNWFIVSLLARQLDMTNSMRMEDYLQLLYHDGNTTDSIKAKIAKLLEQKTQQKLLQDISWFVKYANKHEVRINEYSLYQDIKFWNHNALNWATKIVRKKEIKQ